MAVDPYGTALHFLDLSGAQNGLLCLIIEYVFSKKDAVLTIRES